MNAIQELKCYSQDQLEKLWKLKFESQEQRRIFWERINRPPYKTEFLTYA